MAGTLDGQNHKRPTRIVVLALVFIMAGVLSVAAIWAAFHGLDPFSTQSKHEPHTTLLALLGAVTVLTLAVPAKFLEHRPAQENYRSQAETESRTELENRHELFESLDMEIKRSRRTQRSFAFLRIHIDDENEISKEHKNSAGDNPLCRLAQVLESNCRELDIVVRSTNGEFALVLPEAGPETVSKVTRRIRERLAGDRKFPQISIHIGAAMFPQDASSIETLLEAAGRELSDVKRIASTQTSLCA